MTETNAAVSTPAHPAWLRPFARGIGKSIILSTAFIGIPSVVVGSMSGEKFFVFIYALLFSGIAPALLLMAAVALIVITVKWTKGDHRERLGAVIAYPILALLLIASSADSARMREAVIKQEEQDIQAARAIDYSNQVILKPLAGVKRVGFYRTGLDNSSKVIGHLLYSSAVNEVFSIREWKNQDRHQPGPFAVFRYVRGSALECAKSSRFSKTQSIGQSLIYGRPDTCILRTEFADYQLEINDLYIFSDGNYAHRNYGRSEQVSIQHYLNGKEIEVFRWEAGPYEGTPSQDYEQIDHATFMLAVFGKTKDDAFSIPPTMRLPNFLEATISRKGWRNILEQSWYNDLSIVIGSYPEALNDAKSRATIARLILASRAECQRKGEGQLDPDKAPAEARSACLVSMGYDQRSLENRYPSIKAIGP